MSHGHRQIEMHSHTHTSAMLAMLWDVSFVCYVEIIVSDDFPDLILLLVRSVALSNILQHRNNTYEFPMSQVLMFCTAMTTLTLVLKLFHQHRYRVPSVCFKHHTYHMYHIHP